MYTRSSKKSVRNRDIRERSEKPNEDTCATDDQHGLFAIADGVSSYWPPGEAYPKAARGADIATILVTEVLQFLLSHESSDGAHAARLLKQAFEFASDRIGVPISRDGPGDYLYGLPGAVGTCLTIRHGWASWAHLGDTVMIHLKANGDNVPLTRNQTQRFRDWRDRCGGEIPFDVTGQEAILRLHRDIRNKPQIDGSFGVLTGEPEALHFIEIGSVEVTPGDYLAMLTDGFDNLWRTYGLRPYRSDIEKFPDPQCEVLSLLRRNSLDELIILAERSDGEGLLRSDDKTVVLVEILNAPEE